MALESFAKSRPLTLGIELELQLVNVHDYDLVGAAPDLLRYVEKQNVQMDIKPEMTMSMIEMATGICENYTDALEQLTAIRDVLIKGADRLNIGICGGGTHAFQHWGDREDLRQASLQRVIGAVWLSSEAIHDLRPARACRLSRTRCGAVHDARIIALHPAFHRAQCIFAVRAGR